MTIEEIRKILEAEVIFSEDEEVKIDMVCGSDLMSDVLAFVKNNSLLLTGIINPQVIRTAEMVGIKAICFVRGKMPQDETIELAKEIGIPLLRTSLPMYESCGRLYQAGICGCYGR
ncbi:MAG: DRTGG domain-containing protein [bacterium]